MKTFLETLDEVKAGVKQLSYSQKDFEKLFAAYLNENGYTYDNYKMTQNGLVVSAEQPVAEFRKFMVDTIVDVTKADRKDVEVAMDKYKFTASSIGFFADFYNEFLFQFMTTGRKYNLGSRQNFCGSISLEPKAASTKKIKTRHVETEIKQDAHLVLRQSSGCPSWLKK